MRRLRNVVGKALPIVGMILVLGATLMVPDGSLPTRVIIVVVGLIMVEAGIWNIASALMPNERRYTALREEGDRFIRLIRALNRAAVAASASEDPAAAREVEAVRVEMKEAVDRMVLVAATEAGESAAGPPARSAAPS